MPISTPPIADTLGRFGLTVEQELLLAIRGARSSSKDTTRSLCEAPCSIPESLPPVVGRDALLPSMERRKYVFFAGSPSGIAYASRVRPNVVDVEGLT
jgi:hypothetical protein